MSTERIWRATFGAVALFAFCMAWVSVFSLGDLLVAAAWAFVYAASAFLALEDAVSDL